MRFAVLYVLGFWRGLAVEQNWNAFSMKQGMNRLMRDVAAAKGGQPFRKSMGSLRFASKSKIQHQGIMRGGAHGEAGTRDWPLARNSLASKSTDLPPFHKIEHQAAYNTGSPPPSMDVCDCPKRKDQITPIAPENICVVIYENRFKCADDPARLPFDMTKELEAWQMGILSWGLYSLIHKHRFFVVQKPYAKDRGNPWEGFLAVISAMQDSTCHFIAAMDSDTILEADFSGKSLERYHDIMVQHDALIAVYRYDHVSVINTGVQFVRNEAGRALANYRRWFHMADDPHFQWLKQKWPHHEAFFGLKDLQQAQRLFEGQEKHAKGSEKILHKLTASGIQCSSYYCRACGSKPWALQARRFAWGRSSNSSGERNIWTDVMRNTSETGSIPTLCFEMKYGRAPVPEITHLFFKQKKNPRLLWKMYKRLRGELDRAEKSDISDRELSRFFSRVCTHGLQAPLEIGEGGCLRPTRQARAECRRARLQAQHSALSGH
jgi:hypothetical protein